MSRPRAFQPVFGTLSPMFPPFQSLAPSGSSKFQVCSTRFLHRGNLKRTSLIDDCIRVTPFSFCCSFLVPWFLVVIIVCAIHAGSNTLANYGLTGALSTVASSKSPLAVPPSPLPVICHRASPVECPIVIFKNHVFST